MSNVFIAYASKRGGTRGLADMIASEFENNGFTVELGPLPDTGIPDDVRAVVVAGPIYMGRWSKEARRFVKENRQQLSAIPTWLVASGPLDESADDGSIAPVAQLAAAAERIGARGTQTFGGRLRQAAPGVLANEMSKTRAGDWRSLDHVVRWVREVVAELN